MFLNLVNILAVLTAGHTFSFANRFIDVWNSLDNDIVTAPSLYSFKCRLKSVDFNKFVCVA